MLIPMIDAWTTLCGGTSFSVNKPLRTPRDAHLKSREPKSAFVSARFVSPTGKLDYKLFIPASSAGRPAALLVMLHGCNQNATEFAASTGMNEIAERYQCMVAYPEQSLSANSGKCWNWFQDAHHHRGAGEPALIAGVVEQIMDQYLVDPAKVFVAGHSAGGAMAVVMARTYPELFAAIGCHSGLAYRCAADSAEALYAMRHGESTGAVNQGPRVPMIVFHGDQDSTVHPRNSDGLIDQSVQDDAVTRLQEVGRVNNREFTREIHRCEDDRVLAERWTVHGAGHAWSGGQEHFDCADVSGPDASDEMMRFFMETVSPPL
ncbi:PHB depolymerase family esterase [Massilia sp. PAMC28688]|uniref:extracellular catalytic domain type 1 short-chain-length polyhydroxyalkanoate depolymerase n=1 Tax=Massilia sp. PAMC28688 TaxID=2861283 RepID=UPI001C63A9DC|nr:PHB depolymerase family esterase [Massilia sp. PAMC28688]QYF91732.1 PHB depolymerase family esterase [Massilia sp. PAMC28688]